ncbi:hypothetical protein AGMMS49992_22330 [Clostridia bacterium]|nr:hypothetical protein AGMMS49992_22330 [Clostridia bacterium]
MSFNSKRTIASMVAGVLAMAAYIVYALGERSPSPEDLKSWAAAMLCFIGISVVAVIVIQILFHIAAAMGIAAKEHEHDGTKIDKTLSSLMVEDERDNLISLKSSHVGYVFAGIGFVFALVALTLGISSVIALHTLFGAFAIGSIIEGIVSVCYYEKGVRNG